MRRFPRSILTVAVMAIPLSACTLDPETWAAPQAPCYRCIPSPYHSGPKRPEPQFDPPFPAPQAPGPDIDSSAP
jgi:hypothetical protein